MQSPTESTSFTSSALNVQKTPDEHIFDEDGDLIFSFSDGRRIQVCIKVISIVTGFFDHMQTISARKPTVSSFEASEFDAILLFCQVCYHRGLEIPVYLDGKALGNIAVVVMDFECVNAFTPWIELWTNSLYKNYPTTQTLLDLLAVAYILDDCENFRRRSRELILYMGEEFPYRAFPVPTREMGGLTDLQNQLPESVFGTNGKQSCLENAFANLCEAAMHDWRQALRWNIQTRLEASISSMLDCSCSVAGLFYLRELRRNGLWPLTGRGSIHHIRNLLINGSILTFVPPGGVENCQACQAKPFTTTCKEIGNGIHLGSLGLDLHRWKDLDTASIRDTTRRMYEDRAAGRGIKRPRQL